MPMRGGRNLEEQLRTSLKEGFSRIEYKADMIRIEDLLADSKQLAELSKHTKEIYLLIDRLTTDDSKETLSLMLQCRSIKV